MSLFPRFIANDLAPMFRLMEDYANHVSTRTPSSAWSQSIVNSYKSFTPKFDVKEETDRYVLEGELPGIAQKDVNIEFTDSNTLSIKGRSETVREEGTRPSAAAAIESTPTQATITEGSDNSSNYRTASVEDENTPATSTAPSVVANEDAVAQVNTTEEKQPESAEPKYWVSERSVGEFARSFSFPSRVDHDKVKASMRDGILSIIVPKAAAPVNKRVTIE